MTGRFPTLPTQAMAGRRTSRLSSRRLTRVGSRCCSTSFTTTSGPKGISFRSMRPISSPAGIKRPGATRSSLTDRTRARCATSSSRTPNIGSRNFISTDCASTPSTRSRTIRGPICSTNLRRGFARGSRGPSICCLENEDNDPQPPDAPRRTRPISTPRNGTTTFIMFSMSPRPMRAAATTPPMARTELLGKAIAEGFAYQGEMMPYRNAPRGGPSAELPPGAFVSFIQNHDQIGNRAFGERLNCFGASGGHPGACKRLSARSSDTDVFMGEEWGATQPFLFFCDFSGELAEAVRKGRREEFSRFPEFADPERVAKIPDPSAEATFLASKLDWSRIDADASGLLSRVARDASRTCPAACCLPFGMAARRSCWASRPCGSPGGLETAGLFSTPISRPVPSTFPTERRRSVLALRRGRTLPSALGAVRWGLEPA